SVLFLRFLQIGIPGRLPFLWRVFLPTNQHYENPYRRIRLAEHSCQNLVSEPFRLGDRRSVIRNVSAVVRHSICIVAETSLRAVKETIYSGLCRMLGSGTHRSAYVSLPYHRFS